MIVFNFISICFQESHDDSNDNTDTTTATDKISTDTSDQADTAQVASDHQQIDTCNRLSVTSTSSDVTTNSGKLVSITPDIVKPIKEISDNSTDIIEEDAKVVNVKEDMIIEDEGVSAMSSGMGSKILPSGSGSHLPDMLSHTPEMSQTNVDTEQADTDQHPVPELHCTVASSLETTNKTEMPSPTAGPNLNTASVNNRQTVNEVPKLRITSPFAAYKDTTRHNSEVNDCVKQNISSPSTLSDYQGELSRGKLNQNQQQLHQLKSTNSSVKSPQQLDSLNPTGDTVVSPRNSPHHRSNRRSHNSGPSSVSGTVGDNIYESNLKRSDSYRNARQK